MSIAQKTKPIQPTSLAPSSPDAVLQPSVLSQILGLYNHRTVLALLVGRDLSSRYRGSLLGRLWPLVHPMGQLVIYTFVFSVILKIRFGENPSTGSFAVYFMAGMIVWQVFQESISRSTTVILENPNLVTKVVFPTEILPLVNVFSAVSTQFLTFVVLLVSATVFLGTIHPTVLFLPVLAIPLILFSAGLSWFLASIGVYLRDTKHMINLALQAGMYATPILYPSSKMPAEFRWLLLINPLSGIVDDFRSILLEGHPLQLMHYLSYTSIAVVTCVAGLYFFLNTKRSFADVM